MSWINWLLIIGFISLVFFVRVKKRGFFWKDRKGKELTFKQFKTRWKDGITESTPLQQTNIILWSFFPLVAGILWGITMTIISGLYWMTLILCGSLPITIINVVSTVQRRIAHKRIEKLMKEVINNTIQND